MHLVFVLGPTNVGKTKLLEAAGRVSTVGLVEVGKLMRAKYLEPSSPHYQPDFFKGQAAPTHTAKEAWMMMVDGIAAAVRAEKTTIFVDGQPRDIEQCDAIQRLYASEPNEIQVTYLNLYASVEARRERAAKRDADPAKLALSMQRMEGDLLKIYEVITRIQSRGGDIVTVDTSAWPIESYGLIVGYMLTHGEIKRGVQWDVKK